MTVGVKRDARIELFRCVCMFGICLLHTLTQGGYADSHRGLDNLMTPCVNGFLFISGYYGIRLRLKSVIRLLGIAAFCAILVGFVHSGVILREPFGRVAMTMWSTFKYPWFLWTYLALMFCAPLLDDLFELRDGDRSGVFRKVLPFLAMVFIWSYASTVVPILKSYLPAAGGFGDFTVLTFVGVYVAARTCRYYRVEDVLNNLHLIVIAVVSGALCWLNLRHFNSPFALLFAGSMFFIFKRLPLSQSSFISKVALLLGPCMFIVYLLHANRIGTHYIKLFEDYYLGQGGGYYNTCFTLAAIFFFGGCAVDLLRRGALAEIYRSSIRKFFVVGDACHN